MVYSFRPGPTFRTASPAELFTSALDQPMSITSTLADQAKGGVLESFGLGTAIRDFALPEEAPTEPGVVVSPEDGSAPITLPDTPQMRRRQTVQGNPQNVQPETAPQLEQRRQVAKALDEDQYKASAFYRKDIPWDAGMTEDRAAVLASFYDAKKVREFYAEKRPIASFLGNLAGQAVDPINYIPIVGAEVRAASLARFGALRSGAAMGALDAAANTAAASLGTMDARRSYGDDVSWQTTISQIATAALIGGAFGTLGGAISERLGKTARADAEQRLSTLKTTQEARVALNEAIGGLARDGEIKLSPNAIEPVQRVTQDIQRAVPDFNTEVRGASHGQMDMTLRMRVDGEDVGRIDFSEFEGTPSIQMIEVPKGQRRKGYATELLRRLQEQYPDKEIDWGSLTPDGAKLRETVTFKDAPTEDAPRFKELEELRALEKSLDEERAAKWEQGKGLPDQSPEVQAITERQTEVFNKIEDLEYDLQSATPTKALMEFPQKAETVAARSPAIDTTAAVPDPIPEGRVKAESTIAKPDDYKAMAEQYRVDPETGSYFEEPEIKQIETEGRLTEDDKATLEDANQAYENGSAYGEALKAAVGCLI